MDYLNEAVFLSECQKLKKGTNEQVALEDFLLYFPVYDYVRYNNSLDIGDVATAPFPKSQRVDAMGTHVDWTLATGDDKITAKFPTIGRTFSVWDLDDEGDPDTNVTGVADLGGKGMLCYDEPWSFKMDRNGWDYKCHAPYYCTRERRMIRRTVFDIYETTTAVEIEGLPKRKNGGKLDERIEGMVGNAFFYLQLADRDGVGGAYEYAIDFRLKKHTIRFDIQKGQREGDPKYDAERIKLISEHLYEVVTPEIVKKVKTKTCYGSNTCIYTVPFPSQIKVQVQTALQEQLNWQPTDVIDIYVDVKENAECGNDAVLAKTLSGLFAGIAAVATGGYSAAASVLGGITGGYHTAACLG